MNSFFSKQMTVVDRALNMCKMIFWVQININREKSPWTITPILIHILKTAAMLTTGDLAQMVGALMNDGHDETNARVRFLLVFCFVLFCSDFVCLFVCLFVVVVVCLFCFLFLFLFFVFLAFSLSLSFSLSIEIAYSTLIMA